MMPERQGLPNAGHLQFFGSDGLHSSAQAGREPIEKAAANPIKINDTTRKRRINMRSLLGSESVFCSFSYACVGPESCLESWNAQDL